MTRYVPGYKGPMLPAAPTTRPRGSGGSDNLPFIIDNKPIPGMRPPGTPTTGGPKPPPAVQQPILERPRGTPTTGGPNTGGPKLPPGMGGLGTLANNPRITGNLGGLGGSILGGTRLTRPVPSGVPDMRKFDELKKSLYGRPTPQPGQRAVGDDLVDATGRKIGAIGPRMPQATGIGAAAANAANAANQNKPSIARALGRFGAAAAKGLGMKKGGAVKKMASGGKVSSASKRGDGCAIKGKTKGKMV